MPHNSHTFKKPKWGQHFLTDDKVIEKIVSYANIKRDEIILEIGGGTGNLTKKLAEVASKVIVIELDNYLANALSKLDGVEVVRGDALKTDFPHFNKTVSNLPYAVSSDITFKLLKYPFTCGILMYQFEFAKRMVAAVSTKDYSRLTVCLRYKADTSILDRVPRTAFSPSPQVQSAIVRLLPKQPPFHVSNEDFFHRFVTGIFTQRRKQLKGAVLNASEIIGIKRTAEILTAIPDEYLKLRPYELQPEQLATISNQIFALIQ